MQQPVTHSYRSKAKFKPKCESARAVLKLPSKLLHTTQVQQPVPAFQQSTVGAFSLGRSAAEETSSSHEFVALCRHPSMDRMDPVHILHLLRLWHAAAP